MKKNIFILLIGLVSFSLLGQDTKIQHSEEFTNPHKDTYWTEVLGQDETGFYLLRKFGPISNEKMVLEKYSADMKQVYSKDIESTSGHMGDSKLHRFTLFSNGKIYIFLEGWNKAKKENSLILKTVDANGNVLDSEIVLETEPGSSQMKSAVYSAQFSEDGSKLAILTQKPYVKKANESFRVQVFNTVDFTPLWAKDIELTNQVEKAPKNHIQVNNEGAVYIFKDIQHSWKNHSYSLITVNKDVFKTEELVLGSYQVAQHKLNIDQSGNLIVGATISLPGGRETDIVGTLFLKTNTLGHILNYQIESFGSNVLSSLVSPKNANKEDYVLKNYVLKDILTTKNDGIIMLMEEYETSKVAVGQSVPPVYDHTVTHGNILVLFFTENGDKSHHVVIEKKQKETTRNLDVHFGSFAYYLNGSQLCLAWNYMELKTDPPLNKFRYWVDRNGEKINIDNLYGKETLYPTVLTVINENGEFVYNDRTFNSLPLNTIQERNPFTMAVAPHFFIPSKDGLILLSHIQGMDAKRFRFSKLVF